MTFELKGQHIWARYKDHATFEVFFCNSNFVRQGNGRGGILMCMCKLIFKLGNYFSFHELMDALVVVYMQYQFGQHLKLLFSYTLIQSKMFIVCEKTIALRRCGFHQF
jgi:hypothetical protein